MPRVLCFYTALATMKLKQNRYCQFKCLVIATVLQLSSAGLVDCTEGEVQLVGGQNQHEGRVEVCHGRVWKTVCDRMWREEEAKVVCRQLNYSAPSSATYVRRGCAGQGSEDQDTLKVVWKCSGEESNLLNCNRSQTTYSCDHRRDAGVYCSGMTPDDCEEDDLRLVDGPSNASGRVEVCQFGCWGTVCDEEWDRDDAIVACRQLGFETDQAIPTRGGYFGSVDPNKPIHLSLTNCSTGRDTATLLNCSKTPVNRCTHNQDAGVFCSGTSKCRHGEVLLIDGATEREGRVEMCYNGVWGAVCADGWSNVATDVVCNQLGYTNSKGTFTDFGWKNSPIIFNNITCSKTHSTLLQCFSKHDIGVFDCNGNKTVGVTCKMSTISVASIVLGVVGGLSAVGTITAALVIIMIVVVIRKQKRITFEKVTAVDNPKFDEGCQGTPTLKNLTLNNEYEKEFKNPIYSDKTDIAYIPPNKPNSQLQNTAHDGVYFESTEVTEILRKNGADNDVAQGTHVNGTNGDHMANDGVKMKGATSEGVYELPPNLDEAAAGDENCYSTFNPTYSQLEPHLGVPKPGAEVPCQPNDNDYSRLEYKEYR